MNKPLYQIIASLVTARHNCERTGNGEWQSRHYRRLNKIVSDHMPSGNGLNNGMSIDANQSNEDKLIFRTSYQHMNDAGYYDGWTDHNVTVRASLLNEITIYISGRDRNNIKEYLHDVFFNALTTEHNINIGSE